MELVTYPSDELAKRCYEVTDFEEANKIAKEMLTFMSKLEWGKPAGLAANQVGYNKRICIALDNAIINPTLTPDLVTGKKVVREGCYSLEKNKFDYKLERYRRIHLKWQDLDEQWHEQWFTGLPAQVIQHEYNHLEGRLCIGDKL